MEEIKRRKESKRKRQEAKDAYIKATCEAEEKLEHERREAKEEMKNNKDSVMNVTHP